jgi:hypothetical protein
MMTVKPFCILPTTAALVWSAAHSAFAQGDAQRGAKKSLKLQSPA